MSGFNLNIGNIQGQQVNVGQTVNATQNNYTTDSNKNYANDILHIIGEVDFGQVDRDSLANARAKTVEVDTTIDPFYTLLENELKRQREDNKVMKLWQFSGHGDVDKGLLFGIEWVTFDLFNELITPYDEVDIIVLAACSSVKVADAISGKVKYVLAFAVDVANEDAELSTMIFWKNILAGKSPEEAFEATKLNVPHFAANMRLRGL